MNMWRVGEDMGSKEMDGCPLTVIPNILYQHIDPQLSGQVCCQGHQHPASTITHIRIGPHEPIVPINGQWTFIFGRLGIR
jgi:hypothetical protein